MTPPDPGDATTLDDIAERLRALKEWSGASYETITARVNADRPRGEAVGKSTVVDCFRDGRRRVDHDLIAAIVRVLFPGDAAVSPGNGLLSPGNGLLSPGNGLLSPGNAHPLAGDAYPSARNAYPSPGDAYVESWRRALRVVSGRADASGQVRVFDALPPDLAGFTGRERVDLPSTGTVVLSGMAGVGKTRLAVHLGHRLLRDGTVDRVLGVDLRGFTLDEALPPADPAAVLDGFLRLLGVPGTGIPKGTADRSALYRERLAGRRVLVVLDNAAGEDQVRPLLPGVPGVLGVPGLASVPGLTDVPDMPGLVGVPGCLTLVTSRRTLSLPDAVGVAVEPFTPAESHRFLTGAVGDIPIGDDTGALDRIAARCGHLPLALAEVAGQMRSRDGWSLTDHADRLDERPLDCGVEPALDVSYRMLPETGRRWLRRLALHPGRSFDVHAAAALAGENPTDAAVRLEELTRHHMAQADGPGRYRLHDLVREFAAVRALDEDRRADRQAAVARLLTYGRP